MKHPHRLLGLALALLIGMAPLATSCDKDDAKADINTIPDFALPSLAGTSWRGYYEDVLHHNGTYQMIFTWTIDFNDEGNGMVMMEVQSPIIDDIVDDFNMTYTYDGEKRGRMTYTGYLYEYSSDFEVDPMNHSLDVNLWMHFQEAEDDSVGTVFGGRTTLYQVTE